MRAEADPVFAFARFAAETVFEDLPEAVVATLKRIVLDTLGTALAGSALGVGSREFVEVAREAGGAPEATLIGFGDRVPAATAALANGAMAHALNYDDVYPGGGHLGVVTLPAALAVAERQGGVSGKALLSALAVGAEIAARLQVAVREADQGDSEAKPQPTQMLGVFSAAASAAHVMGLDEHRTLSALGLALMQAAGNRQPVVEGTPAKAVYAAFPNHVGVLSALLAQRGLEAGCAVFEGDAGFFPTFYGNRYHRPALLEGLGTEFRTLGVGFKPWPTTGRAHPFIEAALELVGQYDLRAQDIRAVRVIGGPHIRTFCEPMATRTKPQTSVEAEDSIFFGTLKALANRAVTLADFQPEGLRQPEILTLADCARYEIRADLGHAGIVEVTTGSGDTRSCRVDRARGDPSKPLSSDQLVAKFMDCAKYAANGLPASALREIVDTVERLEELPDVRVLADLLGGRRRRSS